MLHCVVEFCAAVLYVVMCFCMLCSLGTCYIVLFHIRQHCDMLCCVLGCCAVLLHVAKGYYMRCSVVTRCIVLLNFMQQC